VLGTAREIRAHAPHCRVIFIVYEMKRLGRDAAELTTLADHLAAHGLVLEMLASPLTGRDLPPDRAWAPAVHVLRRVGRPSGRTHGIQRAERVLCGEGPHSRSEGFRPR
jgi:hypothetical protein